MSDTPQGNDHQWIPVGISPDQDKVGRIIEVVGWIVVVLSVAPASLGIVAGIVDGEAYIALGGLGITLAVAFQGVLLVGFGRIVLHTHRTARAAALSSLLQEEAVELHRDTVDLLRRAVEQQ